MFPPIKVNPTNKNREMISNLPANLSFELQLTQINTKTASEFVFGLIIRRIFMTIIKILTNSDGNAY